MLEEFIARELYRVFKYYTLDHNKTTNTITLKSDHADAEITTFIDEKNNSSIMCIVRKNAKLEYKECSQHRDVNSLIHYLTFAMVYL